MRTRSISVILAAVAAGVAANAARATSITVAAITQVGSVTPLNVTNITNTAQPVDISVSYVDATYTPNASTTVGGVLFVIKLVSNSGTGNAQIDDVYVQNLVPWLSHGGSPQVYPIADSNTSALGSQWNYETNPNDLPGGNKKFVADVSLDSSGDQGTGGTGGINVGEKLGLFFAYAPGVTIANVNTGIGNYNFTDAAGLALGFHVQGLTPLTCPKSDGSDSYVTSGIGRPVPVPDAVWTGLSVLAGLGVTSKLRRR